MSDATVLDQGQAADQAARVVAEIAAEADVPAEPDIDPDRSREFKFTGFSRMRTDWGPDDAPLVTGVLAAADGAMRRLFPDVYQLMNELWAAVREPVVDPTGEIRTDPFGWPLWQKSPSGAYIEDYSRLTSQEREDFLLRIATGLIEWGQRSTQTWLEAMLAKVRWEEAMADGFIAPTGRITVEERTQRGRAAATEHRYHAVFRSALSRSADQLVRDIQGLGQRIKDATAL
jgi:hypothetical protein